MRTSSSSLSTQPTTTTPLQTKPNPPLERLKAKFHEAGLEPADLVPALVVHEVLGLAMAFGFWGACYAVQPSRAAASVATARGRGTQLRPPRALAALYARSLETAAARLSKGGTTGNRIIPLFARADPARATVSLAESLCLRVALKPATFVFKVWASAAAVVRGKRYFSGSKRATRGEGKKRKL